MYFTNRKRQSRNAVKFFFLFFFFGGGGGEVCFNTFVPNVIIPLRSNSELPLTYKESCN